MEDREWMRDKLQNCLYIGKIKPVIVPMGNNGKLVKEILERDLGIQDILCLDNRIYEYKSIYPVDREENWNDDYCYIITARDYNVREQLKRQLLCHIQKEQIIELFSDDEIVKWSKKYGVVALDFLCVGFPKCGTTSLWGALSQNPNIFLPSTKETFFVNDIHNPSAHIRFRNLYTGIGQEKAAGGIEPAYFRYARDVNLYFGQRLKVLFCVRNPIEAVYSLFKMTLRDLQGNALYYLKKYGKDYVKAFDEWIDQESKVSELRYWEYIKEYLKYYKKENLKIVIWEELLADTGRVMDEIQQFIGLDADKRVYPENLPHLNSGNEMPKNLACAYLNREMSRMASEQADLALREEMIQLWREVKTITNEEYHEKMTDRAAQKLREYYRKSVEDLEQFAGRDLSILWLS